MDFGCTVKSNPQPSKVVQPAERSLGDPSINSETTSVFFVAASQVWFDAALTKLISMTFRIIGPISVQFVRSMDGMTRFAGNRRDAIDQRNQLRHVVAIGTSQCVAQRNPVRVRQDVVLAAWFPAIGRIWIRFSASSNSSDRRAVHRGVLQIDQIRRAKLIQKGVMQLVPDSSPLPFPQATPT